MKIRLLRSPITCIVFTFLTIGFQVAAHQGVPPVSSKNPVQALVGLPQLVLAATDVKAELALDAKMPRSTPLRFAVAQQVAVTTATHGTWEQVADGRLWRLRVVSSGATDLNFGFTTYWLPEGAALYIISESEDYYQGPYTSEHQADHGQLWTPVVPGEAAVVELFVPSKAQEEPRLVLGQVSTGYRDLFHKKDGEVVSKAGACEIDVVCPQGAAWTNEIRSVARISIGGTGLCSATLVMDSAGDFRPFLLTANHCGINAGNAATVIAYWNYQSPTCGTHGIGGSLAQNTSGSTFRAAKADVDFCLIELTSVPDSSYAVYYAGWDRSGTAPASGVGIHHPQGDGKCISFSSSPFTTMAGCIGGTGVPNTHWRVTWGSQGVTEPGSSGSGIWDAASRKVVGMLSGGASYCGAPSGDLWDCYGKVSVGWASGTTAASRLQNWLDPGNTVTSVSGSYPPVVTPPNDTCGGAIALTLGMPYTMSTSAATSAGDPTPTCGTGGTGFGKGVWFTYTPQGNGTVTINTCASSYDTVLQVYTGSCGSLTAVTCNDDAGCGASGRGSEVSFAGTAGTTYRILAGGYSGASGTLTILASLVNDACAGALPLTPGSTLTLDTTTASSAGDPLPTCRTDFGAGVWFTYSPTVTAPVVVSTCGSSFDTVLAIYSGTCGALSPVACNDDNGPDCSGLSASVSFNASAGTTYRILAGGYHTNTGTLRIVARLANDACSGAIALSSGIPYSFNTSDGSAYGDLVPDCGFSVGKGVWFKFTPASSGVVSVSTCGSGFDTVVQAYSGACGAVTGLACNDDTYQCAAAGSFLQFSGAAGATYYFMVGGYSGASGSLTITARVSTPRTMTVTSYPMSGLLIPDSHMDVSGVFGGNTPYARTFADGLVVWFEAPIAAGNHAFEKWQLDGVDLSTDPLISVTMNANHTLTAVFVPINDFCTDAIALTNGVPLTMYNATATDIGDPQVTCAGYFGKAMWFTYTPSVDEEVLVSTCASSFDTVVAVFTGTCGALQRVAYGCDDDNGPGCAGTPGSVVFSGKAGTNYYVLVGGYNSATGTVQVVATSGLVNNECASALPLRYGSPFTMTTVNATLGATDPAPTCQANFNKTVWFQLTSPTTGPVPISTCGSSYDTIVQVFTGTCGALTPVACSDDNGPDCTGVNASLVLNATAGTTYYLMVAGWNGQSGNLQIVAGTPPVLTASSEGGSVSLAWPLWYYPGFVLQMKTNVTAATGWADLIPLRVMPTPIGPTNPATFFRLTTP